MELSDSSLDGGIYAEYYHLKKIVVFFALFNRKSLTIFIYGNELRRLL